MPETLHGLNIKLICDGGILGGNPGGQCYGSWLVAAGRRPFLSVDRQQFPGASTNNEAEYDALLGGLRSICSWFPTAILERSHLHVVTDSRLMQLQVMGTWSCKADNLKGRLSCVKAHLRAFAGWKVSWTPREEMVKKVGH